MVRSFDQEKNKHLSSAEEENDLADKRFDAKNMIYHYKLGLGQVESRLAEHKDQQIIYCEKIRASKDLDSLLESQRLDKNNEGLGYNVVPPPPAQLYSPPKKDLSWTCLPKFADDTIIDYSRPSPTIKINTDDTNINSSVSETRESPSIITSKPAIKFTKAAERPTTDKVETAKKPAVKYAELYKKTTKRSTVRGNQRNWNNLKSQKLRENFVMKNKACFNYGHFDHLSYNCGFGVKIGRSSPKNNYTHRSLSPRPAFHRPYRQPIRSVRPNMNAAQPKRTSFYKPAHSYNKRPFQETTQNLVAILIQRVKRLERELKARTPI
nr:ubiquitin hydrolase [Tanacetum cinerariifolium]